ncbi:MAG: ubiquitin-like domain-containing protein, partial [Ekhidna sp.]
NAKDYHEDLEAYVENQDDELSKDGSFETGAFKPNDHLHFSRCHKVEVTVTYIDREERISVPPSFTLAKLKKKIGKELGIGTEEIKKLRFKLDESEDCLDQDIHIGSLTTYPSCSVELFLVEPEKVQGFQRSDLELFKSHILSGQFQAAVDKGYWEVVGNHEADWPNVYVKIFSEKGNFHLKINLDQYPIKAPKGELWDIEKDALLSQEKRPKGDHNVTVAVRMHYGPNRSTSLYIPCDREGMLCHPNWEQKYPHIWWKKKDTIFKYLSYFRNMLNDSK